MKNFKADYFDLVSTIVKEIISELETAGLTELTIFEGEPYDANIEIDKLPCFGKYWVYDELEYRYIQKVIKCNGVWGIVVYNSYEREIDFPLELTAKTLDFDCANNLYEIVFRLLNRKKTKGKTSLTELAGLAELKKTLGGE